MKSQRHALIVKIVSEMPVSTQEALRDELAARGCNVTQATLSRDIRELGLMKTAAEGGGYKYTVPKLTADKSLGEDALGRIFSESVLSADYALNTVVVKCQTGTAQAVCARLDRLSLDNVVGTLAGDDTIFILMRTENDASLLTKELDRMITNQTNRI